MSQKSASNADHFEDDFLKICIFEMFETFGISENVFLCCWCVLYYNLLVLMRLSDSVSFSVYMKIL